MSGFAAAATIGGEAAAPAQQEASAAQAEAAPAATPAAAATGSIQEGERIKISPRARGIAENQNLDIKKAVPDVYKRQGRGLRIPPVSVRGMSSQNTMI